VDLSMAIPMKWDGPHTKKTILSDHETDIRHVGIHWAIHVLLNIAQKCGKNNTNIPKNTSHLDPFGASKKHLFMVTEMTRENHENPRPPAAQAMNKAKHQGHGKERRPRQGQPT